MTNELEKLFFSTFCIEPRYEDAFAVEDKYWDNEELANKYGTFDQYMNCKCGDQENCTTKCPFVYQREVYPAISDSILLKLICIANQHGDYPILTSIKNIQARTLRILLKAKKHLKDTYSYQRYHNNLVRKVRTLFEEEN